MANGDDEDDQTEDPGFQNMGVVSTCFAAISYNRATKQLQMMFNKGGSYIIEGIEEIEVERWVNSGSPGGYFNTFVRGNY